MVNNFKTAKQAVRIAEPQVGSLLNVYKNPVAKRLVYKAWDKINACIICLERAEKIEHEKM